MIAGGCKQNKHNHRRQIITLMLITADALIATTATMIDHLHAPQWGEMAVYQSLCSTQYLAVRSAGYRWLCSAVHCHHPGDRGRVRRLADAMLHVLYLCRVRG